MTDTPLPLAGLDHVVIRARDIDAMLGFYRDVLGLRVAKHNEPLGLWHLDAGGSMIDLVDMKGKLGQAGGPAPGLAPNVDHVAIKLAAFDETAIRAYLDSKGVDSEPAKTRFGARGDGPSIYMKDPDGNGVELTGTPS
ncbi:MAG: VOC family protein [Alphaproteobacteria bacterium]|nr:VOC family protein [Alphaproteobacteria bacterium]